MKSVVTKLMSTLVFTLVVFASCNAGEINNKAEATAAEFYKSLQQKNYAMALSLCSNKAFSDDSKERWKKGLEKNAVLLGKLQSFTKISGFNIATSTTVGTTVTIAYDVQWQYGKSRDSIILIKEADGKMKVYGYEWQHTEAQYLACITTSEKIVDSYMGAIKAGNLDDAIALCSATALKATPKDEWKTFLNNASDKMGAIADYTILKDSCFYNIAASGESGTGNYYDIYVRTKRNDVEVTEKIILFQKDYNQPVKLAGHSFL